MGQYIKEDPFNIELDDKKKAKVKGFFKFESAHYYNHSDKPLRVGNKNFTGKTHMPTPTKSLMFCNANSILGNLKGHYEAVVNTLPNIEFVSVADWWWSTSCEYADIVWGVDSWGEFNYPDATASVTNPFLQMFPRSPLKRLHDTRGDIEVHAGISKALGKLLNDNRFEDYWKFVHEGRVDVYMQRIMDTTSMAKGYDVNKLEEDAKKAFEKAMDTYIAESDQPAHTIVQFPYTIENQKEFILKELQIKEKLSFSDIISINPQKIAVIYNFLAILELLQSGLARISLGEGYNNFWLQTHGEKVSS